MVSRSQPTLAKQRSNKRTPLTDITNEISSLKDYLPPPPVLSGSPTLMYPSSMPSSYDSTAESFLNLHSEMPTTPMSIIEFEVIPESPHPDIFESIEHLLNEDPAQLEPLDLNKPSIVSHKIRVHPRPKPMNDWIGKNNPKQFRVGLSKHSRVDSLHFKLRRNKAS